MPIEAGLSAQLTLVVSADHTAQVQRTGDVPVVSTPQLVTLAEQATIAAVAKTLPAELITVSHRVQIDHLAPAGVGETVVMDAVLTAVEGRRLVFKVSARDERGLVAAGLITRVLVERERFLERARGGA